ncbi:conserved hypothetical protein [Thiomonas arsenitoxydans]|uniref:Uncharacterized protein n=1 Tax=Thiomonas arsenitoxydans (strain DSM 22701 / CIP 110005 / 3As) TaxID=426114 RepID=D6CSQ9_THIA3|nr:hypothetical protein THI_1651 [Thiomonas arsenitoxydans]CQR33196.1 conserved hypothetical protein [Thiomonas arsenitoxydans]CQR33432.1 conserved hypothetical protein [Thiomonas arsenitoxydans]CQR33501.1 conserved hypothetical protein [Thiomonas arsenitoxydans]CQR39946.1 conserved hypothetical protein [Thiomonas arsenitoxydans]
MTLLSAAVSLHVDSWESVGLGARMAKKTAGAGRRSAILQPAILKSDRLLANTMRLYPQFNSHWVWHFHY